jgi:hypothetical protein
MLLSPTTLVTLPPSLRKGLTRRLPKGGRFNDITGAIYSRCNVLGFAGFKGRFAAWLCRCQCAKLFVREGAYLERHNEHGCGCAKSTRNPIPEDIRKRWQSIKARCYNSRNQQYPAYGKRGIKVCKRWLMSVETFAEDMGPRPSHKHIVARRNKSGNFTPSNCFWGTMRDKSFPLAREITHAGKTQCLAAWAAELGISREAMRLRVNSCLKRGWDSSAVMTISKRRKRGRKSRHD